jgi:hypothetical protein
MFALSKAADLICLVQGGQLYWAFPFSKGSLLIPKKKSQNYKQILGRT